MATKSKSPKKKTAKKKTVGRPSKYKNTFPEQARKLCLLGYTDVELAIFFEVNVDTIYEWKIQYPRFSEAIRDGKEVADSKVVDRLLQRAMGFEHDSEEIKVVADGMGLGSSVQRVKVRKIYPPDTAAIIFWLKNRQKEKWRDKTETDLTTGGDKLNGPELDYSKLSKEELLQLKALTEKCGA